MLLKRRGMTVNNDHRNEREAHLMLTTRRYPRTLQQAFGPYTSPHVYVIETAPRRWHRPAMVALTLAAAALIGVILAWRG